VFYRHLIQSTTGFDSTDTSTPVQVNREVFRLLLLAALRQKTVVDEKYYLAKYPDVAKALATGGVASAADHWYETGYFEHRQPRRILVDEEFYLQTNPDVARALRTGKVSSCQAHFDDAGFNEGRLPFAGFSFF
jgi:hypothetical protein